jgi:hypothetical protein
MVTMTTCGTHKGMFATNTHQAAAMARFGRVGRMDVGNGKAFLLRLVGQPCFEQPMGPLRHTTAGAASPAHLFGDLRYAQIFQDQYAVWRCPLDQLFGCGLNERAGAIVVLAAKPFESTSDTARILALCLTGSQFLLQSLTDLVVRRLATL